MHSDISASAYPQQTLSKSFLLHILPGASVTLGFLILKPLLDQSGYPPLLAFLLAILLIDLPVLWGIMLFEGKKLNGNLSLEGVVLYREKISLGKFVLIFIAAFVVMYAFIMLVNPVNAFLTERLFFSLPDWIFLDEQPQYQTYAKNILVISFVIQLILTGIILPWVEELYFRGYLLPRISRYSWWAPIIGGAFFGLYHSWQLYSFPTVFLLGAVLGYLVMWTRDIRLGISLHVVANTVARLVFLMLALGM